MRDVTVCDSFSADIQPTVRALERIREQKKKEGLIHQYRLVNKEGVALLQTKEKKGDGYRGKLVTESQLSDSTRLGSPASSSKSNSSRGAEHQALTHNQWGHNSHPRTSPPCSLLQPAASRRATPASNRPTTDSSRTAGPQSPSLEHLGS